MRHKPLSLYFYGSVVLLIVFILTMLPACTDIAYLSSKQSSSSTASNNAQNHDTVQDLTSSICVDNWLITASTLDTSGNILALLNSPNTSEFILIRYDCRSGAIRRLHSFHSDDQSEPVMLSGVPCVIHSPSEDLVYLFGDGKNMQIIDLCGSNIQSPVFCSDPKSLFWTDSEGNQVFCLSIENGKISPSFDNLLEYNNIKTLSSNGSSILLSADSLKDSSPTTLISNGHGEIIETDYCSNCIYGTLGSDKAQLHLTDDSASIIHKNIEYPLGLKAAPVSAIFTNDGILAVLCSDDHTNYQLLCYSLINGYPSYIGSSIHKFANNSILELSGVMFHKEGDINALLTASDNEQKIYLWHMHHMDNTVLMGTSVNSPDAMSISLNEIEPKIAELEANYNIRILYGDDAIIAFPDYDADPVYDETLIVTALEKLDLALSRYPEGYFSCITEGVTRGILFCLTGPMHPKNNVNISNPEAFAVIHCNTQIIALNIAAGNDIERTIYHEISHATDKKIAAGAADGSIEFSEDMWNSFNPNGFEYFNAYLDPLGNSYSYTGGLEWTAFDHKNAMKDIYFVDSYSKTFASEDRARLMEAAMSSDPLPDYINSPNIQAKLSYYFAAIRQIPGVADNSSLYWERALITPTVNVTGR